MHSRRPGVVDDRRYPQGARGGGNSGNILHFERERARRFQEDRFCVGVDQLGDFPADARIVIAHHNAQAFQQRVAEPARRPINGVRHQDFAAGFRDAQERQCARPQPGRRQHRARTALDRDQRFAQRLLHRHAFKPVGLDRLVVEVGDLRQHNGGGAVDRCIHRPVKARWIATRQREPSLQAILRKIASVLAHQAAPVATGVSVRPPHSVHEPS